MHVLTTQAGMPWPCYMTVMTVLLPGDEDVWKGKATSPCELMPRSNSITVFVE